jgi:DNA-directed RNA polymerase sigma subunit (sigma70/sigma32)
MELESMLAKLTGRERLVIELTYGLTGQTEMSPADIAPVIGVSTERVRQITNPVFRDIYAPLDGFIVNGGIKLKLKAL